MNDYKEINVDDYYDLPSRKGKYKVIRYDEYGNIWYERYLINGKFHRENGAAIVSYHENGNIILEYYYLCNKEFPKEYFYSPKIQAILDIAKMMNTWESKLNFIHLSLKNELNE